MIKIYVKRRFDLIFGLKKSTLLIEGCALKSLALNDSFDLPESSFLLQIKIEPDIYSNTMLINKLDSHKIIMVKPFGDNYFFIISDLILAVLSLVIWSISRSDIFLIAFCCTSIIYLFSTFFYTSIWGKKHAIKIELVGYKL
jgi:hypothetical protein